MIDALNLQPHVEGGYFVETDRDPLRTPSPFNSNDRPSETRSASTTIFHLLTPAAPVWTFHRNRGRTVHTLHKGRGRYVHIHADDVASGGREGKAKKVRVETFVVGQDVGRGERLQWIVEGGKYKCSFLLTDGDGREGSQEGCLISETVVPGFEFEDHDFLRLEGLRELVAEEQAGEMEWMVRRD